MTPIEAFLATMSPMQAAKAGAALSKYTRLDNGPVMKRSQAIETCIAEGYRIASNTRGERVLMAPDSCYLDAGEITKTGLDYAAFLEGYGK